MAKKDPLPSFAHLPREIDEEIRGSLRVSNYAAGETIFMQGVSPQASYLVGSGRVKIVRVTPEGHESILCVRGPGDYFCPVPLLDGGAHLGTAVTMEKVTLLRIDKETFDELCNNYPVFLTIVQGDCLGELRNLMKRLEAYAFRSIRERVAFTLLEESQRKKPRQPAEIHITQQDLAGLVGASRESVSRSLNKLAKEGILSLRRGRVTICDPRRLGKICS